MIKTGTTGMTTAKMRSASFDLHAHARPCCTLYAGGCLCVVNTHLFFHPYAPHIRTMHTAAILEEAAAFLQQAAEDPRVGAALGGSRPTVLFCGDLNSDLNDGIPGALIAAWSIQDCVGVTSRSVGTSSDALPNRERGGPCPSAWVC